MFYMDMTAALYISYKVFNLRLPHMYALEKVLYQFQDKVTSRIHHHWCWDW